jgi:hypothetical protein
MEEEKQMGLKEWKQIRRAAVIMEEEDCRESTSSVNRGSSATSSSVSAASLSSSDLADDASSSSTLSSSPPSSGPLYEMSELMDQLPIKRGLSKFYNGKSQTFASLANVNSVEDLAKKEGHYGKRMKSCKSYGGNLNHHQKFGPKAAIAKRSPKRSFSPSLGTKTDRGNVAIYR